MGTASATAPVAAPATAAAPAPAPPVERSPLTVTQALMLSGDGPRDPLNLRSLAIDGSGNILVSGTLRGSLPWGAAQLTSRGSEQDGPSIDAFLGSLDASFRPTWASLAGSLETDEADAVAAGKDLIVNAGSFVGEAEVGGNKLAGHESSNILITAFEPGGTLRFARAFGNKSNSYASRVALGERGDIVVGGYFEKRIQFDKLLLQSGGLFAATFLTRLHPDGHVIWAKAFGGRHGSNITAIAVDGDGNTVVGGKLHKDDEHALKLRGKQGEDAGFLMKLAPDGKLKWARRFPYVGDVAIHLDGIIAVGAPDEAAAPPGGVQPADSGLSLVKLSKDGEVIWAKEIVSDSYPMMTVGQSGMVVFTSTRHRWLTSTKKRFEMVVATSSPEGEPIAKKTIGMGEGDVLREAVAVRPSGAIVVMGNFRGDVDFGKGVMSAGKEGGTFLIEIEP